jgi:drug/metabolite transporter (DMT)-like permease
LNNAAVADRRCKTMIKLLLILCVGLVFESTGVILLKKGMTQIGDLNGVTADEIFRVCKAGATNPQILLGVFFEALFFACLLILMSKSEISFLWPLTALSFVFATFAAMWFLGERVSSIRWIGVILIMIGAAFISYSEHVKEKPGPPPATTVNPIER